LDRGQLVVAHRRPKLVQLYRQALFIGDRQVGADLVLDMHGFKREASRRQQFFQLLTVSASGNQDGQRLRAERMQHARGVNSAPTRGEVRGFYVSPVLEYKAVNSYIPVDGGVSGKSDNQLSMLPVPRRFSLERIRGGSVAGHAVLR